jgi:nicotinamidase-related amidase
MSTPGVAAPRVRAADAALVIVDIQERLASAMSTAALDAMVRNVMRLVAAAELYKIPVAVSEQYPKGLGRTLPIVREGLGKLAPAPIYMEKSAFSLAGEPLMQRFLGAGRKTLIVVGMEAHVCVFQTVRDLCERGFAVHVPGDALLSRTPANHAVGVALCERAGAVATSTEAVLFDMLERAGTEEFRVLSRLIK